MRFTIQGLMLVMLFAALGAGIYSNRKTARESIELDKLLRSELHTAQLDMLTLPEGQRRLHLDRIEMTPQWSIDRLERITQHLTDAFEQALSEKCVLPMDGQISIISVPVVDRNLIHRKWLTNIPETGEEPIWLVVQLTDPSPKPSFEDSRETTAKLSPGENMIDVRLLRSADRKEHLQVHVNDQPLVERSGQELGWIEDDRLQDRLQMELHAKEQQDFSSDDALPNLFTVKPSKRFGCRIRLQRGTP